MHTDGTRATSSGANPVLIGLSAAHGGVGLYSLDMKIRVGDPMVPHVAGSRKAIPTGLLGAALGAGIAWYLGSHFLNDKTQDQLAVGAAVGTALGAGLMFKSGKVFAESMSLKYQGAEKRAMQFQEFAGFVAPAAVVGGALGAYSAVGIPSLVKQLTSSDTTDQ